MATPTLRAFRQRFSNHDITFLAPAFTRDILSPCQFCDNWLIYENNRKTIRALKAESFDTAILLKNSFSSALAIRLAGIGRRIGYARDGRSFLLTDKIRPLRTNGGIFQPAPMIEYYLKIAEYLEAPVENKKTELSISEECTQSLKQKLTSLNNMTGPLIILVPGGAFGPSKLWPVQRYAKLADMLYEKYNATVVLSIAPVQAEIQIAEQICAAAKSDVLHVGRSGLSGGQLKALFSLADLVITNDTGPRHIAIALNKNTISLFGPNNPQWTQTAHDKEIQIVGKGPCVPCDKPTCRQSQHLCMESITVDDVFRAAESFLKTM